MIVLAWILLLPSGPYQIAFVDFQECKSVAAKYEGAECVSRKIFVAKSDLPAIVPKENKAE